MIQGRQRGTAETQAALPQLMSVIRQAAVGAMTASLELFSRTLRQQYLRGPYPTEIERRTGSFAATFQRGHAENIFEVRQQGHVITGRFGSTDRRARILDEGGVIRPRHGTYLAVRSDFTKTSGGVVRAKYQQPLRNLPNTFVRSIRAPKAKAAVFERLGRGRTARVIPIAWLVTEVTITGRKFMEKTVNATRVGITEIWNTRLQAPLQRLQSTLGRLRR